MQHLEPLESDNREAPSGVITLLFTDIEGSTALLQRLGHAYAAALLDHQRVVRAAARACHGYEVDTQGDAFFFAFQDATQAVAAAVAIQRGLAQAITRETPQVRDRHASPQPRVKVRIGIHSGEPALVDGRYIGLDVHRAARICGAAHGDQVVVSDTTHDLVAEHLPAGVTWRELGEHRLKDLRRPRRLYQLVIPGLPDTFPPLRSLDAHRHNLPTQATTLVGRDDDIRAVRALLAQDATRLITLTGPGGVGKTRLALQTAAESLSDYPDGVFFVALAAVTDPDLAPAAIAQALDLQETGGRAPLEAIKAHLRERRALLVLDNFEQVTAAGRHVTALLAATTRLQVLVTSRAVLRVYGEQEYPVPALAIPTTSDQGPGTRDQGPRTVRARHTSPQPRDADYTSRITQYPAVRLFIERARAARPDFALTAENAAAVAGICARLDGLPLAIELAAARSRLLTPQAMLSHLERSRIQTLNRGMADLPARQQTLRASIDWSYDLLDETRRAVFRRLAVFAGGFTLDAAAEVVAGGGVEDVVDGIEVLLDGSLLQAQDDVEGEPRFGMLETIREYALDQLQASGEAAALRQSHATRFTRLAEAAKAKLWGAEQKAWLTRLDAEQDNLRAALGVWRDQGNDEMLLRLASGLWMYWHSRGRLSEGLGWLSLALARTENWGQMAVTHPERAQLRANTLNGAATLASARGEYAQGKAFQQERLGLLRALGDTKRVATALGQMGVMARHQGEYGEARRLLEASVEEARAVGDASVLGYLLNNLGALHHSQGDYNAAWQAYHESAGLERKVGDQRAVALALSNLGELALDTGDSEGALAYLNESLQLYQELQNPWGTAWTTNILGLVARLRGDDERAESYHQQSLGIAREMGNAELSAYALWGLGELGRIRGQLAEASQWLAESLTIRFETGDLAGAAESLTSLALLFEALGQSERTARLLGSVDALRQSIGAGVRSVQRDEIDACVARLAKTLGRERLAELWAEGTAMDVGPAVAEAQCGQQADATWTATTIVP